MHFLPLSITWILESTTALLIGSWIKMTKIMGTFSPTLDPYNIEPYIIFSNNILYGCVVLGKSFVRIYYMSKMELSWMIFLYDNLFDHHINWTHKIKMLSSLTFGVTPCYQTNNNFCLRFSFQLVKTLLTFKTNRIPTERPPYDNVTPYSYQVERFMSSYRVRFTSSEQGLKVTCSILTSFNSLGDFAL